MNFQYFGLCDAGKRDINEDFIACYETNGLHIMFVADGMGASKEGLLASELAVKEIIRYLDMNTASIRRENAVSMVYFGAYTAGRMLSALKNSGSDLYSESFSTTLTAFILFDDYSYSVVHIGNSRAYMLRQGQLYQLTRDETEAQTLFEMQQITYEQLLRHPQRNILTKSLGMNDDNVTLYPSNYAAPGDMIILMTNGIFDVFNEQDMLYLIQSSSDTSQICESFIKIANETSGVDNSAIILCTI